ncbi:MAG: antibiotic biosynthesis monooxygenase family protein [Terriglobales bacterium]
MQTRIVQCNIKPEHVQEVRSALNQDVIPLLRKQPGFVDVVESLNAETGQFVCMSIWANKDDSERWGEKFNQIAAGLAEKVAGTISVSTGELETSTAHQVAAGKAA